MFLILLVTASGTSVQTPNAASTRHGDEERPRARPPSAGDDDAVAWPTNDVVADDSIAFAYVSRPRR
uniref:Secreted protein n=1 Tax=Bursaphelenchus xylophilus TaxID=6326 RepID=A0A1I7SRC6_BURXY